MAVYVGCGAGSRVACSACDCHQRYACCDLHRDVMDALNTAARVLALQMQSDCVSKRRSLSRASTPSLRLIIRIPGREHPPAREAVASRGIFAEAKFRPALFLYFLALFLDKIFTFW